MKFVHNSNTILKVYRLNSEKLFSECTILNNKLEITGWIIVNVHNFIIENAAWEAYRSPDGMIGQFKIPELEGIEAYLHSGEHLKRILGGKGQEIIRELISNCIRGIVQVDCFLLDARGYKSYDEYFKYFSTQHANACYLYSNTDKWDWKGKEYNPRTNVLFTRLITTNILCDDNGKYYTTSLFSDSHHQLNLHIITNSEGIVTSAEGEYDRGPRELCFENKRHFKKLIGKNIFKMNKKDIASLVGGSEGCDHLVSLVYNTALALRDA